MLSRVVSVCGVSLASWGCMPQSSPPDPETARVAPASATALTADRMLSDGQAIFRFDTFGSEAFWGDSLKLHTAIAGSANGGVGPGISPNAALQLGLKVDSEMLGAAVVEALDSGTLSLDDPATTLDLLRTDA